MTVIPNVAGFLLSGKDRDTIALHQPGQDYSYGQLQDHAIEVSDQVLRLGGQRGDRVVLLADNSLFWAAAYLGTMGAGLVSVPLPSGISSRDLEYVLSITEAKIVFVQAGLIRKHEAYLEGLHIITDAEARPVPAVCSQSVFTRASRNGRSFDQSVLPVEHDDLAALMFTSGSTGKPRGVMVSHANIIANTEATVQYLNLTERDRIMVVLPFHYCFGTSLLHTHLRVGGSLVVGSRFLYPETVLDRMAETQCTGFAGVPSHFQILLRNSSLKKRSFPRLRYVQQAGGALAPAFIDELRQALPQAQVFIMYGQTEATSRLSYLPPEFLDSRLGSIGKGIPGVRLRVLNESGQDVAPGEVGEIVAEGKNIALGYWCAPEEAAAVFREGRLHTGDLGRVDEAGFIYIVDRARDFLKCGGERISCRQIEEILLGFSTLLEVAVVGVEDPVLGEAVQTFVVFRESPCHTACHWMSCREVRKRFASFCKEHLPPSLVPRRVVVLPELPKNGAGKVLKMGLRDFGSGAASRGCHPAPCYS